MGQLSYCFLMLHAVRDSWIGYISAVDLCRESLMVGAAWHLAISPTTTLNIPPSPSPCIPPSILSSILPPIRGVDSSHATWTRVGLESLFLWLVTWLGLAKKWLATWLGLAKKWLATWLGLAKKWLATWLGLARKWLVTNASQKLLERPRDLINF